MTVVQTEIPGDVFDIELPASPYPGLRPFYKHEWPVFFGRETMTKEVIDRLIRRKFVAVHGASGCGKSSLISAGVLPRLEQDHARGGATWRTCTMRPERSPIRNLARELADLEGHWGDEDHIIEFQRLLNLGRDAAKPIAKRIRRGTRDYVCILVDQFEELFDFARASGEEEAALFVDILVGFQQKLPHGLHIVLTMRSEYLGSCSRFPGLAEAINLGQYLLPNMGRRALLRAIREPAVLYNGAVDRDLAERLIAETGNNQDQLPLIQHGLMLLHRRKIGRRKKARSKGDTFDWRLTIDDYRKSSGLEQLLSGHADQVVGSIKIPRSRLGDNENAEQMVEQVFRALTDINAEGHAIRRPQQVSELMGVASVDCETLNDVLLPLRADGVSFIRPYGKAPLSEADEIDISHEALIRCWQKIADPETGWLHKEFQDDLIWQSLRLQATGFEKNSSDYLSRVATNERGKWLAQHNEAWALRHYSEKHKGDQRADKKTRSEWDAVQRLLTGSKWHYFKVNIALGLLGLAVLAAAAFTPLYFFNALETEQLRIQTAIAEKQRVEAEKQKVRAELSLAELKEEKKANIKLTKKNFALRSRLLAKKSSEATESGNAGSGLAYALWPLKNTTNLPYVPQAEAAAYAALFGLRENHVLQGHTLGVNSAKFSPDGKRIVTTSNNNGARVWDAKTGIAVVDLKKYGRLDVFYAEFSPDSKRIVTAIKTAGGQVWDAKSGVVLTELNSGENFAEFARFSPDGRRVVTASDDNIARVWDAETGESLAVLKGHKGRVWYAAFSPDGRRVVTASDDTTARLWDAETGESLAVLKDHKGRILSAAFSPDGRRVVTPSDDTTARLWDAETGESLAVLKGHKGRVWYAAFSPDGRRVVTASDDTTARLWDAETAESLAVLKGHEDQVLHAAFSPDGRRVVTASDDRTARLWDAETGEVLAVLKGHKGMVWYAAFSPDGKRILTASEDETGRLWSVTPQFQVHIGRGQQIDLSRQDEQFVKETKAKRTKSSADTKTQIHGRIAFTRDGKTVARVLHRGEGGVADIWNWRSDDPPRPIPLPQGTVPKQVLFIADLPIIAFTEDQNGQGFGFSFGGERIPVSRGTKGTPDAWAISADGQHIAVMFAEDGHADIYKIFVERGQHKIIWLTRASIPVGSSKIGFNSRGSALIGANIDGSIFKIELDNLSGAYGGGPDASGGVPGSNYNHQRVKIGISASVLRVSPFRILDIRSNSAWFNIIASTRNPPNPPSIAMLDSRQGDDLLFIPPTRTEGGRPFAAFDQSGERAIVGYGGSEVQLVSMNTRGVIASLKVPGKRLVTAAIALNGTAVAAATDNGEIVVWPIFPNTAGLRAFAERVAPHTFTEKEIEKALETKKEKR